MARAQRIESAEYAPSATCTHVFPDDHPQKSFRGKTCTWSLKSSLVARDNAKAHTEQTGHNTIVVREIVDVYARAGA